MIDICQALYKYLTSKTDITNIVGNRIYPTILPQNCSYPAIVYSPIIANYDSALEGDTGFVRQTIQIVCHDATFKKARELSRIVKNHIQDFHGNMEGLIIEAVFIKSDFEMNGNTTVRFETDEFMTCLEFEFYYNEK